MQNHRKLGIINATRDEWVVTLHFEYPSQAADYMVWLNKEGGE